MGGSALFVITGLVSLSVFFRYVLNQPILGDQELVEIGMSLVVMLSIPFTAWKKEHIRVDVLDAWLGATGRFVSDLIVRIVSCFVLFLLVQKTWAKTLDAHEYGDVTNMIEIPVAIAYGAITLGMFLFIIVLVVQLIQQIRHGMEDYE